MKVEKIETVTVYNNEGRAIEVGEDVIVLFNNDSPDVIGIFKGLVGKSMIGVSCSNGEHHFKQSNVKDIKVFE